MGKEAESSCCPAVDKAAAVPLGEVVLLLEGRSQSSVSNSTRMKRTVLWSSKTPIIGHVQTEARCLPTKGSYRDMAA